MKPLRGVLHLVVSLSLMLLQARKLDQAKKDKALIDQMSSLNPAYIRDPDRPDYQNMYNDWKQTQIAANQLPNNSRQRLDVAARRPTEIQ